MLTPLILIRLIVLKKNIEDINEWVNKLNEWFHKELSEYIKNPKSGGISNGGSFLPPAVL